MMILSCFSCLTIFSSAAVLDEDVVVDEEGNVIERYWTLEDTGVLTIFKDVEGKPWAEHASIIKTVIVESGVTFIPNSAFAGYPVLSNVIFKGTLERIEAGAFQECDGLSYIDIPGTAEIEDYAFYGCDNLVSVGLYGGLQTVGKNIFKDCTKLESVDVKNGARNIGESMFEDCISLKTLSLPDSIVSIGRLAFENCAALENIVIPDSTVSVGEYAFYGCSSVKSAYIGHNVQEIGEYAFGKCAALEDVEIKCAMPVISDGMFFKCSALKGLTNLPEGIKTIGKNAFAGCSSFDAIVIPSSVTSIADSAFDGTALVNISIPGNVEEIGAGVFTNCNSLTDIEVEAKNRDYASVDGALYDIDLLTLICCPAGKSGTYTVYDGAETISEDAFIGCENLTVVEIPDSVSAIASNAFNGCANSLVIKASCGSVAAAYALKRNMNTELSHEGGVEWVETVEPTCTTDGERTQRCVGCGFVYGTEVLEALGHTYDNGVETTKVTCDTDGVMTFTCTRGNCGYYYTEVIPATGHAMDEGTVKIKATCDTDGEKVFKCTNAGCIKTESVVLPATGHKMDKGTVELEATCTEEGKKVYKCVNADCEYEETEAIPATGHKLDNGTVVLNATCTEEGKKVYKCVNSGCLYEEYEAIPATGHEYKAQIKKDATCIEDGILIYTCVSCKDSYTETFKGEHIPYSAPQRVEPTCEEDGTEGTLCSICKEFIGETTVLPATGHSFENGVCTECGKNDGSVKPATPELIRIKNTIRGPVVKWEPVANATGYKVYAKVNGKWTLRATIDAADGATYVDTKAESGVTYTYSVKAVNGSVVSGYDKEGLTITFIDDPALKSIANTQNGVKVKWGKVAGATEYNVYRRTASTDWGKIAVVKGTSYVDETAKSGKGYIYVVRASDGKTLSSYDANGINIVFVGAPEITKATSTKSGISLKWGKVANADGYIIYRKTAGGSYERVAKVKGNSTVSYKDSSAKKGVKYSYVVKAYDGSTKSYKSDAVTLKDLY